MLKNKEVNIPVLAAHGEHSVRILPANEVGVISVITTCRLFREMKGCLVSITIQIYNV